MLEAVVHDDEFFIWIIVEFRTCLPEASAAAAEKAVSLGLRRKADDDDTSLSILLSKCVS